jgi:hypothetical protein
MSYPLLGNVRFPKLKDAKPRSFNLSDIRVTIDLHPLATRWREEGHFPSLLNIFDDDAFGFEASDIGYRPCYESTWDIKGAPLIGKQLSDLDFRLILAKCNDKDNLFVPSSLLDIVKSESLKLFNDDRYYLDVIALKQVEDISINGLSFTFHTNEVEYKTRGDSIEYIWTISITEKHFLQFIFSLTANEKIRPHISAVKDYCTSIMQTVQIDFPEWAEREKAAAASASKDTIQLTAIEPLVWKREADTGSYLDFRREAAEKSKQTEEQD